MLGDGLNGRDEQYVWLLVDVNRIWLSEVGQVLVSLRFLYTV